MAPSEFALGTRQIYILPTRHGLLYALVLVALLLYARSLSRGRPA